MALTKVSNNALSNISVLPSAIETGALTLLSTQTASSSASISFTSGIDSTYDSYVFKFIDINPATDNVQFQFNGSTDGGSNYNVTKTTTFFSPFHLENDTNSGLNYDTPQDLAQSTASQRISYNTGNDTDTSIGGTLQLFNPSSTTFVKHFISNNADKSYNDATGNRFIAGYFNTTSAVDAIKFEMSSGNFDGIIKMYGVS